MPRMKRDCIGKVPFLGLFYLLVMNLSGFRSETLLRHLLPFLHVMLDILRVMSIQKRLSRKSLRDSLALDTVSYSLFLLLSYGLPSYGIG